MTRHALVVLLTAGVLPAALLGEAAQPAPPTSGGPQRPEPVTQLLWVGPDGGKWSEPNNWAPAKIPGNNNVVVFDGKRGRDTDSVMDLGGGALYHVAGLRIEPSYTRTVTLHSRLQVDVLDMSGGTLDGAADTRLILSQAAGDPLFPATYFRTSFFTGGTIKVNVATVGEDRDEKTGRNGHWLTFVLAGHDLTPSLEADLTTDPFTQLEWRAGNMTVAPGKTITLNGMFVADSKGAIGNDKGKWDLVVNGPMGGLGLGKGILQNANVQKRGGKVFRRVRTSGVRANLSEHRVP
jgi:hypothetical protein